MVKKGILFLIALVATVAAISFLWVSQNSSSDQDLERPFTHRILFIGNSFTANNGLDQLVIQLLKEAGGEYEDSFAARAARGGYTFATHWADANSDAANPRIRYFLFTGSDAARDWDTIVLQEQSQILGFGEQNQERIDSFRAAAQFTILANEQDATVYLVQTWGYVNGDPDNQSLYPDYVTMQQRLTQGIRALAAQLSTSNDPVQIVPVGRAFSLVYHDLEQLGQEPLTQNSRFRQLYDSDGRHPSLNGSYLAAAVFTAVYTNAPVVDLDWRPRGMDDETAVYLRSVADRAVFGEGE